MDISRASAVVTGGASGLGLASVHRLVRAGAKVVIVDLPSSNGAAIANELGDEVSFVAADVRDAADVGQAFDVAESLGTVRVLVHCAGRGAGLRLVDRDGNPGSLELYTEIVTINLVGTFNVLGIAAARMARNAPSDGDCGVAILTASVAAFEGQIGQIAYASSKAGIAGMTIVASRDLASKNIRVCTIAPGIFDTPILDRLSDDAKASLTRSVPHPNRLGQPAEFAKLALHIVENGMLNGETIRLDGAIRMPPR